MKYDKDVEDLLPGPMPLREIMKGNPPVANAVFFRAKQKELVEQYASARRFLDQTETPCWDYWFEKDDWDYKNEMAKLVHIANFYEIALFYYNVVIDLSWAMVYVSAEYACTIHKKRVQITGMQPIDRANEALREIEKHVKSPTDEEGPFGYLLRTAPSFEAPIKKTQEFWKEFVKTPIRGNYNYCKHKGKPRYVEMDELRGGRISSVKTRDDEGNLIELITDITDAQMKLSLKEEIARLFRFDNECLYPYIKDLMDELEKIIDPSPLVR